MWTGWWLGRPATSPFWQTIAAGPRPKRPVPQQHRCRLHARIAEHTRAVAVVAATTHCFLSNHRHTQLPIATIVTNICSSCFHLRALALLAWITAVMDRLIYCDRRYGVASGPETCYTCRVEQPIDQFYDHRGNGRDVANCLTCRNRGGHL
jgi:hypothetical protein